MEVHASLGFDLTLGFNFHKGLNPAMGLPRPIEVPSIEMPCTMAWPPGMGLNKNKLTTTVSFNEQSIVQDGHDLGPLLLDITPFPVANLWYAVMWPFSSRKVSFGAAKVQADGAPFGGAQMAFPLPLVTCGEPLSLPTSMNVCSWSHRLTVGFELSDVIFGYLGIAAAIAIDFAFSKALQTARTLRVGAGAGSAAGRKLLRRISSAGTKGFSRYALRLAARQAVANEIATRLTTTITGKSAVGAAVEGALSFARGQVNGTHEWGVKIAVGSNFLGAEGSYTFSPDASRRGAQLQGTLGPGQVTAPLNDRPVTTQWMGSAGPTFLQAPPPSATNNGRGAR